MVKAFPGVGLFSKRAMYLCPAGLVRRHNTAASEKAHLRWALPIVGPDVPTRVPADAWAPVTSRH
jgi:hypothetical protein